MPHIVTAPEAQQVTIGIDWADQLHAFHLFGPGEATDAGMFQQDARTIEELILNWRAAFPGATFVVAIEQSRGPLISALLKYEDFEIYPVNPAALANYRKAFAHGGEKMIRPMRCF